MPVSIIFKYTKSTEVGVNNVQLKITRAIKLICQFGKSDRRRNEQRAPFVENLLTANKTIAHAKGANWCGGGRR